MRAEAGVTTSSRRQAGGVSLDNEARIDAMFHEYQETRDRDLRNELVLQHRWIPDRCAKRFYGRGEPMADLVQVGELALVGAVERFDPDVGSFPKFAVPTVLGELKRYFRDRTWRVSVPRRSKDLVPRMNLAVDELQGRTGDTPTVADLAEYLDVDVEMVRDAMQANRAYRPISTDQRGSGDDEQVPTESQFLRFDDDDLDQAELRTTIWEAISTLDEQTRKILLWRFYEGRTQTEIGDRLGVGQVQVSRLLRRALAELRDRVGEL